MVCETRENLAAARLDLQVRDARRAVQSGLATVNDHERLALTRRRLGQTEGGERRERCSCDQQGVGAPYLIHCAPRSLGLDGVAKECDVGLQDTAAASARWDTESGGCFITESDLGITVSSEVIRARIQVNEISHQRMSRSELPIV